MLFLSAEDLQRVKNGQKTLDARIRYSYAGTLREGDVYFYNVPHEKQHVQVQLKRKYAYSSFAELMANEDKVSRHDLPPTNSQIEKEFGVVCLEFVRIK